MSASTLGDLKVGISLITGGFTRGVSEVVGGMRAMGSAALALNQSMEMLGRIGRLIEGTIGDLSKQFIEAAATSENYRVRLDRLLQSHEQGGRVFQMVSDYAQKSTAEYNDLMNAATNLAGVVKGGADEIMAWMPMIDDLAAISGLSIQETTGQVVRMFSAGAGAADLFRERGVLAMMGFQSGVKYSVEQTMNMMVKAYDAANSKIKGASQDLATTWGGEMSMISDKWFDFRNMVMNEGGLFKGIEEGVSEVIKKLDEMKKTGELSAWARAMASAVISALEGIAKAALVVLDIFTQIRSGWLTIQGFFNDRNIASAQATIQRNISTNASNLETWGSYEAMPQAAKDEYDRLTQEAQSAAKDLRGLTADKQQIEADLKATKEVNERVKAGIEAAKGIVDNMRLRVNAEQNRTEYDRNRAMLSGEEPPQAQTTKPTWTDPAAARAQYAQGYKAQDDGKEGKKAAKEAQQAAKELATALKQLAEAKAEASFEVDVAGLNQYARAMAETDNEARKLSDKYADVIVKNPALKVTIQAIADLKKEAIVKESEKTVTDQIAEVDFQISAVGMDQVALAAAEVNFQFRDMIATFPKLKPILDELASHKQQLAIAQGTKQLNEMIAGVDFERATAGMNDYEQAMFALEVQVSKLREQFGGDDGLNKLIDEFWQKSAENIANKDLLNVKKQISDLTDWKKGLMDAMQGMSGALSDFLMQWMETGKGSFKELAQAFVKELDMIAARYTAELLMLALYSTIRGLVSLASNDGKSGQWFSAAAGAAIGAVAMGSFVAGAGLAGMAHDGMGSIPEDGTWLLKKGERVVDDQDNKDLKGFLAKNKDGGKPNVTMNVTIQGGDEQSVLKALPKLKETIIETVHGDISGGGQIRTAIMNYT